ncbi:MAG: hypothetical protein SF172_17480 [Burkholderiales bacterium]|nr:hypothetical protein [Burkholderiales bacterium]
MTKDAYGVTVFCDDIRHEVNGKMTLVGCYASELNFSGPPPGILPTFAALVNLRFPRESHFETLTLHVTKIEGGDSTEIFSAETKFTPDAFLDNSEVEANDSSEKILSVVIPIQWTPLVIAAPALIRVRAKLDSGEEVRAGSLTINFPATISEEENPS